MGTRKKKYKLFLQLKSELYEEWVETRGKFGLGRVFEEQRDLNRFLVHDNG